MGIYMQISGLSGKQFNKTGFVNENKSMQNPQKITFKGLLDEDIFEQFASEFANMIVSSVAEIYEEIQINNWLDVVLESFNPDLAMRYAKLKVPLDSLIDILKEADPENNIDIKSLLKDCNIETTRDFCNFIIGYNNKRKDYFLQEYDALRIFGLLKNKEHFTNYPELLLFLYNNEKDAYKPQYEKLDTYCDFLKNQCDLKKFDDFETKFAHLKSDFSDFESVADKTLAIKYLMETYPEKIKLIKDVTKNNKHSSLPDYIYKYLTDIIDYLFIQNNGKNLSGIEKILSSALESRDIKEKNLQFIYPDFNNFQTTQDKINFYDFLLYSKISAKEFNLIAKNSLIENYSCADLITNMKYALEYIQKIKNCKKEEALNEYANFSDIYCAILNSNSNISDNIKIFNDITKKNGIKNSNDFIKFYSKTTNVKKEIYSQDEILEFLELFSYNTYSNLKKAAKEANTSQIELLKRNQSEYLYFKPQIESFIFKYKTDYFIGKSIFEIYNEFKELFREKPDSIENILLRASSLNVDADISSEKYINIEKLSQFFENEHDSIKFILNSKIKFDNSKEDNEYINNCITLLNSLSGSKETIEYFSNTTFLSNSASKLSEYIEKYQNNLGDFFTLLASKKVQSLSSFENSIAEFATENGVNNIIEKLKETPDTITFDDFICSLEILQNQINELYLPFVINNDNISDLDCNEFLSLPLNISKNGTLAHTKKYINILNSISNSPSGTNFISALPNSFTKENDFLSNYVIAHQLVTYGLKEKDDYKILLEVLKLTKKDLGLKENCTNNEYIKKLSQNLPNEFTNLINSSKWLKINDKTIKLSTHAKLRLITRFALDYGAEKLYSKETQEHLQSILNTIYTQNPTNIKSEPTNPNRFVAFYNFEDEPLKVVLSKNGDIITLLRKAY